MIDADRALSRFRSAPEASDGSFRLVSSVAPAASADEIEAHWRQGVPQNVADLWLSARSARLFVDADYGQWGLALLDPAASKLRTEEERSWRPDKVRSDDIVVGEFLGDQDLLFYSSSEVASRRVLVALPTYDRGDWPGVASSLAEFLTKYFAAGGQKFWEPRKE